MMRMVMTAAIMVAMAEVGHAESTRAIYTGCLEPGPRPGSFTLTRVERIGKDAPVHGPMSSDATDLTSLNILSTTIPLTSHLGQKVTVTGYTPVRVKRTARVDDATRDPFAFTVRSLKVVAASCS